MYLTMELFSRRRWATGSAQQSNMNVIFRCICCITFFGLSQTLQLTNWAKTAFISFYYRAPCLFLSRRHQAILFDQMQLRSNVSTSSLSFYSSIATTILSSGFFSLCDWGRHLDESHYAIMGMGKVRGQRDGVGRKERELVWVCVW